MFRVTTPSDVGIPPQHYMASHPRRTQRIISSWVVDVLITLFYNHLWIMGLWWWKEPK